MVKFRLIASRLLQTLPVLLGISLVTFVLIQIIPGDPVRLLLGPKAAPETVVVIRARYGLDEPILLQYFIYLKNLLSGDLGRSIVYRAPVLDVIGNRISVSLFLLLYGLIITLTAVVLLSVMAARKQGSWVDQIVRLICITGLGLPSYWLGIMFILLFSLQLGLFPVSGFGNTFIEHLHHLFLPALTIGVIATPILTRNLRAALIEQMMADYVNAGRSKGLPEDYIFWAHVFRNSLLSTVHLTGVIVSFLIGGTVVIETVFAIPGLGQLMIAAILGRDYFVIQGVTLIFALGVVITNLLVDIASTLIDPRIRQ